MSDSETCDASHGNDRDRTVTSESCGGVAPRLRLAAPTEVVNLGPVPRLGLGRSGLTLARPADSDRRPHRMANLNFGRRTAPGGTVTGIMMFGLGLYHSGLGL